MDSSFPQLPPPAQVFPYLTGALPGSGGVIRQQLEDFVVEEQPLYTPSGTGEHLYLMVEKRGLPTSAVLRHLGQALGLPPQALGAAGLKDAQGVTRQWISLHTPQDPDPALLETGQIKVVAQSRHLNKLRTGHLAGNRFEITVRAIGPQAPIEAILSQIEREGFPNYFGPQRFGQQADNARQGKQLVQSGFAGRLPLDKKRFLTNSYQSALFNELVAIRVAQGCLASMLEGDIAVKHANGASFAVLAPELAQAAERAEKGEISPSAPLFGYKSMLAQNQPGLWENHLLEREGLTLEMFKAGGKRLAPKGERRPVRALAHQLAWQRVALEDLPCLRLTFMLEAGVYATSLLREVMKNDGLGPCPL